MGIIFLDIDYPLPVLQENAERAIGWFRRRLGLQSEVPFGAHRVMIRFVQGEQNTFGALHQFGDGANRTLAELRSVYRKGARKSQPFFAVVVAVVVEMLADGDAEPGTE